MKTSRKAPAKKQYTIQHQVDIFLGNCEEGGWLTLLSITSANPEENRLIGTDDGEFLCWDADVTFQVGGLKIVGADGPGGGTKTTIILIVPQDKIRKIETESY